MDSETFDEYRRIVYENCGISLGSGKESLVSGRVSKRMRQLDLTDHSDYIRLLRDDSNRKEMVRFLDAISTNVTSFFREPEHFDFFARTIRQWAADGQRRFRIWSAACSTGEEPYSLAMTAHDVAKGIIPELKILATDISLEALEKAKAGAYDEQQIRSVPGAFRNTYFTRQGNEGTRRYVAGIALRKIVTFGRMNLAATPYPMQGPFDFVFCRNVMIYFDNRVRQGIIDEAYRLLKSGGYLIVGHTESLTGLLKDFECIKPSIYVRL